MCSQFRTVCISRLVRFGIVIVVFCHATLVQRSGLRAEDQPVLVGTSATGHMHPSICRTKDGTLIVVFKGANVLMCSRSLDQGQTWNTPEPIATTAKRPSVIREVKTFEVYPGTADVLPDDRVLVTWNYIADDKANDGYYERALLYTISSDQGRTWTEQGLIGPVEGKHLGAVRHNVLPWSDGRWLLPLRVGPPRLFDQRTGELSVFPLAVAGGKQHSFQQIVRTPKGTLLAMGSEMLRSTDDGRAWGVVKAFRAVPDIDTAEGRYLTVLADGRILVTFGVGTANKGLSYNFSADDGVTWNNDNTVVLLPERSIAARYYSARTIQIDDRQVGTVFLSGGVQFLRVGIDRVASTNAGAAAQSLRVSVFRVDATPPLGTPVAYAPARKIEDPLSARGVVLLGSGMPIVLCAVDWIGIGNGGHDAWRESLADAVGTSVDRVTVHVLHQHDGVRCDFTSEELLAPHGLTGKRFDVPFVRQTIANAAAAAKQSLNTAQPVTHLGVGEAKVDKVASNRRILGPNGRVAIARSSSYRIPEPILSRLNEEAKRQGYELSASRVEEALAAPEGVIDPFLKMLTFFNGDRPIVSLSYYATHPQSYFGQGDVTAEFVGLARTAHEKAHDNLPLIHFNGASGNVAAGKYNDGTPALRVVLTERMADGMRRAWAATKKVPLSAADCDWRMQPVRLPVAPHLDADQLRATLNNQQAAESERLTAASKLAFVLRRKQGIPIELSCLKLAGVSILHLPGELFVEYQLAAQQMRRHDTVCMAAYGDLGTGYIGTEIAYSQGGYETQPSSSNTAPQVERVLLDGIRALLKSSPARTE